MDAPGKFKLDQGEPSWRETHALLVGRRTIDRGDNTGVPATEQRGFGFPRQKDGNGDGGLDIDIGAFER